MGEIEAQAQAQTVPAERSAAILVARSSVTGLATREMESLAARVLATGVVDRAAFAFSEQGVPALREALTGLADEGITQLRILPMLIPMEPGFHTWIERAVNRWRAEAPQRAWPRITIATAPAQEAALDAVLRGMLTHDGAQEPRPTPASALPEAGSLVPAQKRRVLVCRGGPCNNAGAPLVWGHLRNEQKRLNLRTVGDGVMTATSSCLGPCKLAPVLQVFPEGTYYGGVDERGVDAIVARHLLAGEVVTELAYDALPHKQALR